MSAISIAPYFPFHRAIVVGRRIHQEEERTRLFIRPDLRFAARCSHCGCRGSPIHSWQERSVRDLNLGSHRVWLSTRYRKIHCPRCKAIHVEQMEMLDRSKRVTPRLARYIHELCKVMTVKQVAEHLGLDWKTVKNIDKTFLEKEYGTPDLSGLRIIAVDEIAIRKGHRYMTVVLDYLSGRVVWLGRGRKSATLAAFFDAMENEEKESLEAIAMDMWDPYIKAVREKVPHVKIVFDLFHVVAAFNRVIDKVRVDEYRKAAGEDRKVIAGSKFLLLSNRGKIRKREARRRLKKLLELNETIAAVMILRDQLKRIWSYRSRRWAAKRIREWCALAGNVPHPKVKAFARQLQRYNYGILNHCDYSISTASLEGTNNKIKVIKRTAYGFHDERYFSLKVIQAFDQRNRR
jgi:transposase